MKKLTAIVFHPMFNIVNSRGFSIGHYTINCREKNSEGITLLHPSNYLTEEEFESKEGQEFISLIHKFTNGG